MKQLIIVLILSMSVQVGWAQKSKINWMSFEEALVAQKNEPRKIMMDVYTDWCGPCKLLDKNTFQNPDVVAFVNANYYAVKFNAEGDENIQYKEFTFSNPNFDPKRKGRNATHELAGALNISAYPTIVFFNESGETLLPVKGYQSPNQLELFLKLFNNDDYKKISTQEQWETYQKQFIAKFKS